MILKDIVKNKFSSVNECLFPDNGEAIIIPNGFGIFEDVKNISKDSKIDCPVFTCMIKEGFRMFNNSKDSINLQYFQIYEKYLYFISNIYKSYLYNLNVSKRNQNPDTISYRGMDFSEDKDIPTVFFSLASDSKTGLISNSLGMDKSNITKMMNFMIKYKFLELFTEEHSFVDYSKGETLADKKCRQFIVSNQFYRFPVKYFFKSQKIVKTIQNMNQSELDEIFENSDDVVNFEKRILSEKNITSYTFPKIEELLKLAENMVKNEETDKWGRIYSFGIPAEWYHEDNGKVITKKKSNGETYSYTIRGKLKTDCPYVDINIHIYNYILMMNNKKIIKKRKKYVDEEGNVYYDRFYSFLSMIPKWIRNQIKIDGEEIVECDATALHPRIIAKMFETSTNLEAPEFLKGDSHSKISDILNISRKEAKLINLSYWNSKIVGDNTIASNRNKEVFKKMDDLIKSECPKLFEFLKIVKCDMKAIKNGKGSHSNMSVMLMDHENRIMQEFLDRFGGFSFIYCYDSIAVKKSCYDFVKKNFDSTVYKLLQRGF